MQFEKFKPIIYGLIAILTYYLFSITLTFYNRYVFVTFEYPLSITVFHLIVKFILAASFRSIYNFIIQIRAFHFKNKTKRVTLEWSTFLKKIVPLSVASAADIGFSNWSLQYISVTLYTMSKSTAILFILFFALVFKLEKWVTKLLNLSITFFELLSKH